MNELKEITNNKNGGKMSRIGKSFRDELNDIKKERIKKGLSEKMASSCKITNLITRHALWKDIKKDIINAEDDELEKYG